MAETLNPQDYIAQSRWTELLNSLKAGSTNSFVFPSSKAMESCRVTGARMNMMGESKNTFRFSPNFKEKILVIMVDKRDSHDGNDQQPK